nr:PREDICTED: myb-related transcription factor, partner of profilin-like [Tribolium castaneum]|eukprot:XP_015839408.1 PREDICTED: myb-related transcription factor, partner of profilin-like [Tribolium castaneum]
MENQATIKKGRRAKNFTPTEVEILIVEVENRRNILFGPLKGPSLTQYHRDRAWDQVLSHVNSVAPCVRSVGELKKKFKDLKSRTKSRANALLRESRKTGGGENDAAPLNAFEEKMLTFVGKESVEGIRGGIDTFAFCKVESHDPVPPRPVSPPPRTLSPPQYPLTPSPRHLTPPPRLPTPPPRLPTPPPRLPTPPPPLPAETPAPQVSSNVVIIGVLRSLKWQVVMKWMFLEILNF